MTKLALAHGPPLTDEARTLWDLLSSGASKNEDAIAVHSVHQNVQLTFRQLLDSSERIARSWSEAGITTGPVLVLVGNCVEFVQLLWAAARLGVPFCPVNPKSNEELLQHYIQCVKPEVIVVQNSLISNTLNNLESSLQTVKLSIVVDDDEHRPDGWKTLEGLTFTGAQLETALPDPKVTVDDVAIIIFTSGTTSMPKGAIHTGITLSSLVYTTTRWRNLTSSRKMLCHIPTFHVFAVSYLLSYFSSGAAIIFPSPSFDAAATLRAMELGLPTDASLVPSMYRMLVEHPNYDRTKVRGMKTVGLGGSMIPPDFVRAVSEAFSARAFSGFGMSEAMGMLSWHEDEEEVHTPEYVSVGKAGYGVSVKVSDPHDPFGKPLNRGEDGELQVSGPLMVRGYLGGVSAESFYRDESGIQWFKTGDQARMDTDGAIYILGRYKDIIIRGGENISPAAIEVVLNKFEGVEVNFNSASSA
jgi:acyl-CoA synthetase (AMP-forming)/AMP-acid ligase II